jgi:hypothetical protein
MQTSSLSLFRRRNAASLEHHSDRRLHRHRELGVDRDFAGYGANLHVEIGVGSYHRPDIEQQVDRADPGALGLWHSNPRRFNFSAATQGVNSTQLLL